LELDEGGYRKDIGKMGFWAEVKHQITGTKLMFNVLFHGGHMGLFALGWYEALRSRELLLAMPDCPRTALVNSEQVQTSI